jgi:hypothetical protein
LPSAASTTCCFRSCPPAVGCLSRQSSCCPSLVHGARCAWLVEGLLVLRGCALLHMHALFAVEGQGKTVTVPARLCFVDRRVLSLPPPPLVCASAGSINGYAFVGWLVSSLSAVPVTPPRAPHLTTLLDIQCYYLDITPLAADIWQLCCWFPVFSRVDLHGHASLVCFGWGHCQERQPLLQI